MAACPRLPYMNAPVFVRRAGHLCGAACNLGARGNALLDQRAGTLGSGAPAVSPAVLPVVLSRALLAACPLCKQIKVVIWVSAGATASVAAVAVVDPVFGFIVRVGVVARKVRLSPGAPATRAAHRSLPREALTGESLTCRAAPCRSGACSRPVATALLHAVTSGFVSPDPAAAPSARACAAQPEPAVGAQEFGGQESLVFKNRRSIPFPAEPECVPARTTPRASRAPRVPAPARLDRQPGRARSVRWDGKWPSADKHWAGTCAKPPRTCGG